ncbi:MAG: hypothetical protein JXA20_19950 [Spirochaetes bacterium]|nr:hypothetical protein [Spirochaetota bacterium]
MRGEVLFQNIFNLFIIAVILEASVSAVFSISALQDISDTRPVKTARDVVVLLVALFLCFKVTMLGLFHNTGFEIPQVLDAVISALVLMRLANFIRDFFAKIRMAD